MKKTILKYLSGITVTLVLYSCSKEVAPEEPCFKDLIIKKFNVSQNTGLPWDGVNPTVKSLGEILFTDATTYNSTVTKLGSGTYVVTPITSSDCRKNLYVEFKINNGTSITYRTIGESARIYNNAWFFDGFVGVNKNNLADTLMFGSKQ